MGNNDDSGSSNNQASVPNSANPTAAQKRQNEANAAKKAQEAAAQQPAPAPAPEAPPQEQAPWDPEVAFASRPEPDWKKQWKKVKSKNPVAANSSVDRVIEKQKAVYKAEEKQLARLREQYANSSKAPAQAPAEAAPPPEPEDTTDYTRVNSNPALHGRPQKGNTPYLNAQDFWNQARPTMMRNQQPQQPMFSNANRFSGGSRNAQQAQQGIGSMNSGGAFNYQLPGGQKFGRAPNPYTMAGPGPNTNLPYERKAKTDQVDKLTQGGQTATEKFNEQYKGVNSMTPNTPVNNTQNPFYRPGPGRGF